MNEESDIYSASFDRWFYEYTRSRVGRAEVEALLGENLNLAVK
jgi:hypothetical protein